MPAKVLISAKPLIAGHTLADAIMDRLMHGSHTIALKGESLRRYLQSCFAAYG